MNIVLVVFDTLRQERRHLGRGGLAVRCAPGPPAGAESGRRATRRVPGADEAGGDAGGAVPDAFATYHNKPACTSFEKRSSPMRLKAVVDY